MKSIKPKVKYQGISLSVPFIAEIKKHVMYNPRYNSIADFAREAIREKLQRDQSDKLSYYDVQQTKRKLDTIEKILNEIKEKL